MIIGIDASRTTSGERTGTEQYSLHLIRAMLKLDQKSQFRLYCRDEPPVDLFEQSERTEYRVIPFPRLWTHIRLSWEMAVNPPDVLFVPSHVLPLIHPKNSVSTVHDLGYIHYPQAHTRSSRLYLDWSTRYNAKHSRQVIADSEATRQDLINLYKTDGEKITVAYPAGQRGLVPITDNAILEQVQQRYGTGDRYFIYVGTLQPRKNLGTLIRAFAAIANHDEMHSIRLVLVGRKGWLYEDILALAHDVKVSDRIVFTGYIDQQDLAPLLSGALAFVMPSWYEGFGLPLLEAMTCETPIICSNVSSLPEVVGDAAITFDPADQGALERALLRITVDPALRENLISQGLERVQAFTWESCARTILEVLYGND